MALTFQYRYVHTYAKNLTDDSGLGYWEAQYSPDSGTTWLNIDANIPHFQSLLEVKQALQFITGPLSAEDDSSFVTQVTNKTLGSAYTATTFTPV